METHTKKHILGFVGLAAVTAMTAVAYTLPTPDAAAVNSTSTDVTYSVEVHEKAAVSFEDNLDGTVFAESPITIKAKYSEAKKLSYYLTYTNASGQEVVEELIREYCPGGLCANATEYLAGTDEFTIDFADYGGYGVYKLHVVAEGVSSVIAEDYATFEYSAGAPHDQGTDENGNPIIDIEVHNSDVDHAYIQLTDENGNPLFVDENGNPTPVYGKVVDGHIIVTLPFDQYNIPNGTYYLMISYYDVNGNLLYIEKMKYIYSAADQRKEIAVPDTGFLGLGNLNFSNPDYWIAGLAGLTALAGGAYYVSKRAKSRR